MMSFSNITSGRKTVTAAGTAERLVAARTPSGRLMIRALPTNTKPVAIGDSTALATVGSEKGVMLNPNDPPLTIYAENLHTIFIDAEVSGQGVTFTYEW